MFIQSIIHSFHHLNLSPLKFDTQNLEVIGEWEFIQIPNIDNEIIPGNGSVGDQPKCFQPGFILGMGYNSKRPLLKS